MKGLRAVVVMAFLWGSRASAAPAPWLEVKSQHFSIVTNSSEKDARKVAWQFEQIRQTLKVLWPWAAIDGGRPVTIVAARDEATLKTLGPQYWEGKRFRPTSFWVADSDRTYIALRTDIAEPDDIGENPYQTAYWSYINLVFHRSLPVQVPAWYSRGVSEVLSNTIVREKEVHVGRVMRNHLERMREQAPIPLDEFLAADRNSKYLTRDADSWLFEAQSWTFVHYLLFSNRGEHGPKVDRFNQLLLQGTPSDRALMEAFGPDMTPFYMGMRDYLKKSLFTYGRVPVAIDLKPEAFGAKPLNATESALVRARLLVAMGRPVEARAFAAEAKGEATNPGPFEIEGLLLDRERKTAEAQTAYEKAAELGSARAPVYYRLAQLARPTGRPDPATNEKIAALLRKAIELEPELANALSYLADVQSDLGKPAEAIPLAEKAVRIQPDSTYHRTALARALWNAKRPDEAIAAARAGLAVADTDQERASAQQFLDFAQSAKP